MKKSLIIGILLLSMGGQAMSMGHPHNLFAARKSIRTKTAPAVLRNKSDRFTSVQLTDELPQTGLAERFVRTMIKLCQAQLPTLSK